MGPQRRLLLVLLVVAAVAAQVSLVPGIGVSGVIPDVVLVVVVAVALTEDPRVAMVVAFGAGVALDLAPPADHTIGRWALAFVVVAYLAGLVRHDAERSRVTIAVVVGASSFVGISVFALSGILVRDPGVSVAGALGVIPLAVLYDVLLALALVPLVRSLVRRAEPVAARW